MQLLSMGCTPWAVLPVDKEHIAQKLFDTSNMKPSVLLKKILEICTRHHCSSDGPRTTPVDTPFMQASGGPHHPSINIHMPTCLITFHTFLQQAAQSASASGEAKLQFLPLILVLQCIARLLIVVRLAEQNGDPIVIPAVFKAA